MTDVQTQYIDKRVINDAYSYQEYRQMIDEKLKEGKTTGENHSESMIQYTKMNVHRMNRIDKQVELSDEVKDRLESVERPMIWLVLTEAWCGDAAQNIPPIQMMADQSDKIKARYILRDQNLDIMDQFLTDGTSRSIPKLICLDAETFDVIGEWGPRPQKAQKIFKELRGREDLSYREVAEKLHKWYADDKTETIQDEFLDLLDEWESTS